MLVLVLMLMLVLVGVLVRMLPLLPSPRRRPHTISSIRVWTPRRRGDPSYLRGRRCRRHAVSFRFYHLLVISYIRPSAPFTPSSEHCCTGETYHLVKGKPPLPPPRPRLAAAP